MATAKKTIRKPAVKKQVIKLRVIYHRCDERQSLLIEKIMSITKQKTASKAIFDVCSHYEELKKDLQETEDKLRDAKNTLRENTKMGLKLKECFDHFSNLKPVEKDFNNDDDDFDEDFDDDDDN